MCARRTSAAVALVVAAASLLTACDSDDGQPVADPNADTAPDTDLIGDADSGARFPDIVDVAAEREAESGSWTFRVTVASPYDTPQRYADGWRIVGPDGTVYGVHTLFHEHAAEQPFTRTQTGVVIPDDVDEVIVEGRDLANGYGGATVTVTLDRD